MGYLVKIKWDLNRNGDYGWTFFDRHSGDLGFNIRRLRNNRSDCCLSGWINGRPSLSVFPLYIVYYGGWVFDHEKRPVILLGWLGPVFLFVVIQLVAYMKTIGPVV